MFEILINVVKCLTVYAHNICYGFMLIFFLISYNNDLRGILY